MRSYAPLVLVGHGSEYGILGPNNALISWQDIGAWVNTLPNTFVFFLACNSNGATKFVQTRSYGFSGTIDGVLGAISVAANLQYVNGNTEAVQQLLSQYVLRAILLQSDRAQIIPLVCYYGPIQPSSTSSDAISPDVIPCPPPPPAYTITFTESGLHSGASWSVNFGGWVQTSTASSITFTANSGFYLYSISVSEAYSYHISPSSGSVSVNSNINIPITLTAYNSWSPTEISYWILMSYVTLLLVLVNLAVDPKWAFINRAVTDVIAAGYIGILLTLGYVLAGDISLEDAFGNILSFIDDMTGYAVLEVQQEDLITKVLFLGSFVLAIGAFIVEGGLDIASGGGASMAKYLASGAVILALAGGIMGDYLDYNDYIG